MGTVLGTVFLNGDSFGDSFGVCNPTRFSRMSLLTPAISHLLVGFEALIELVDGTGLEPVTYWV